MDLYDALKVAGCEIANHESDLYVKRTAKADAIIREHATGPQLTNRQTFRNNIDGLPWYDFPFSFSPYWRARESGKSIYEFTREEARAEVREIIKGAKRYGK